MARNYTFNRKNILTVNVDYSYNHKWGKIACHIEDYDNIWQTRSLFGKLLKLLFIGHNFEIIVFNYDVKLAFLFSLFHHLYPYKGKLKRCIFVTLLIDVSIFSIKNVHRYIFYYIFVRLQDRIIIHTREEKFIYSESFKIRLKNKFIFIPYFSYEDNSILNSQGDRGDYIICPGNHRDIDTFAKAISFLNKYKGIVIGGEGDRHKWENYNGNKIKFIFNLPYEKYKQFIANAGLLVVPLKKEKNMRSLGIIATFQAVSLCVPVIVPNTFHLKDYFSNKEILFYDPGNYKSLAKAIQQSFANKHLSDMKVKKAKRKLDKYYTNENFLINLTNVCSV